MNGIRNTRDINWITNSAENIVYAWYAQNGNVYTAKQIEIQC